MIGAGATGVELAGTLAEIARHTLKGEFRRFDSRGARVVLLEGGDRVLAAFPAELSVKARDKLIRLGVEVRTGARVTGVADGVVDISENNTPARIEAIPDFTQGLGFIVEPVHTMTGIIAQEMGEVVRGSIHYRALFMVGLVLFVLSLTINYLAQGIVRFFRQVD